jgi:hypothetical protein
VQVRVFRLISLSPVEEAVLTRAQNKLKIDQMVIQSGKFDEGRGQKTTSEERKTLLQDILRTDVKLGDAVAPTDAEINRMMCRSEEEYERFQAMDEEITREDARVWKELKNTPCPGRLITEDELPIHVRHVDLTAILDEEENLDTSKRAARAVTSYADALSDREWARCLDQGIDPNVYAKKKQDRKAAAAAAASSSSNGRDRQGRKSRPIVVEDDEEGLKSDDDDQLQDDVSEDTGVASDIESSSSSASEEEAASAVSGSESDVSFDGRGKKRRASAAASSSQPSSAAKRGRASTSSKKTPAKGRGAPARSRSARKWQSYDSDAEEASRDDSEPMIVDASAASSASKRNNPKRKTSQVESTPDEETPTEGRASRSRGAAGSRASRLSASPSPSPSPAPAASPLTPALSRRAYMAQKRNSDAAAAAASASQERATSSPTSNAAAEEAPTSSSSAAKRRKR